MLYEYEICRFANTGLGEALEYHDKTLKAESPEQAIKLYCEGYGIGPNGMTIGIKIEGTDGTSAYCTVTARHTVVYDIALMTGA
jgi:hypothetical protein